MRDYASLYSLLLADLGLEGPTGDFIASDSSSHYVARKSLADSFFKKLCPDGNSRAADAAALKKFRDINASLPESFDFAAQSEVESCFIDYFRDNLWKAVDLDSDGNGFSLEFIRETMNVGPGAAQLADSRCMMTKLFASEVSYTDDRSIGLYRAALSGTGLWAEAEMQRFVTYGFTRVNGGKLFFAPKNAEISRTCCTEASLELILQKACGAFTEVRLGEHFDINLSTQPDLNRELARIGSIDGSFATIDLVSASDSIGLSLMQKHFPPGRLKTVMMQCRSERAVLPDGSEVTLRMVSTMGNGFTFPLQTLLFACAVRSVYQLMALPEKVDGRAQWSVFGDDIVVRREAYEFVCRMLHKLGFTVNVGKSYNTGPFRESCGHDYFKGVNVRGVYVRSLETPQEVSSIINRLTRWSALHGVPLPRTLKLLLQWTRIDLRIPPSEADDAGIKVPFELTLPKLDASYWFKYRYWKKRTPKVEVESDDPEFQPPFSDLAAGVGFLSGHLRRRDFSLITVDGSMWSKDHVGLSVPIRERRGARARYKIASSCLPFWDYLPDPKMAVSSGIVDAWASNGSRRLDRNRYEADEWRIPLTRDSLTAWKAVMMDLLD